MQKIVLIHFHPLENYPPVMNFIRYWEDHHPEEKLFVYTTNCFSDLSVFKTSSDRIIIKRFIKGRTQTNFFSKLDKYVSFYGGVLWSMIRVKPERILYYETISSFPATVYRKFFNTKVKLLIHYHEYTSPREYEGDMWLTRRFHKTERKIYPFTDWISHTNEDRMRKFLEDNPGISIPNRFILPNYPPKSWFTKRESAIGLPVKLVYIGAVSLDTMFTKELAEWVTQQKGKVSWDIYASNITAAAKDYLLTLAREGNPIHFRGSIDYFFLPQTLAKYDIGIILYKGHIPNYVYNVPNKLFEYHTCGLDVWFPVSMVSSLPLATINTYPKIIPLDFTKLNELELDVVTNRTDLKCKPSLFYAEEVFEGLYRKIVPEPVAVPHPG
jgi:hypothetical protein